MIRPLLGCSAMLLLFAGGLWLLVVTLEMAPMVRDGESRESVLRRFGPPVQPVPEWSAYHAGEDILMWNKRVGTFLPVLVHYEIRFVDDKVAGVTTWTR